MKKKLITGFVALLAWSGLQAQNPAYVVSNTDGVPYENNSLHVFNVYGTDDDIETAKLYLIIDNYDFDNDIYVRAEVVEIINTDGQNAQFCIAGVCLFAFEEGQILPNEEGEVVYGGNGWGPSSYILNTDPTNLSEYKIRFVQTDGAGNEIPNTNFFISYRYDKNMGLSEVKSLSIAEVYPTVAKNFTNVNLKENAEVQIFNAEGKAVRSTKMNSGSSQLDLSGLSKGVYWVAFKGQSGSTTNVKIVVK
ncbi:MAG TPA: T9SS type A sorting domain-containing protein [Moheibacter sp.]|nr:T9SS type A sorting domain-containing protein [Moheibacter sp.]